MTDSGLRPFTGEQIRAGRAIARLDQGQLADAAGLSLDTIKRIERIHGPVQVKARAFRAIIEAFRRHGVELDHYADRGFGVRRISGPGSQTEARAEAARVVQPPPSDAVDVALLRQGPEPTASLWNDTSVPLPSAKFAVPPPNMIAYCDRNLNYRCANEEYLNWLGCDQRDLVGRGKAFVLGQDLFAANETFIRAAMRGEPQRFERTLHRRDNSRLHAAIQYIPDPGPSGEVQGMWVVVTDISVFKEAELRMARANAMYQIARRHAQKAMTITSQTFAGLSDAMRKTQASWALLGFILA